MVLGSPQQRSLQPGVTYQQGLRNAAEVLAAALPTFEETGVTLAFEPLAPAAAQEEPQVVADQAPLTSAASPRAIDDAFMDLMSRVRRDPSATSATPLIATTPPTSQTRSGEINDEFNKLLGSARTKG